ncbi:hypothetical protein BOX15_Mlig013802g1 [Macrostomum lignano]|uniref:glutaminyl-peptide cyclotransferase n=1 Tax=Macrostomum lignano TaxID=282301 RepID=A0A267GQ28_9PLAT|nr:hypothetical protein BOX15_Mlig013802g1 [Macrostomum lignano]
MAASVFVAVLVATLLYSGLWSSSRSVNGITGCPDVTTFASAVEPFDSSQMRALRNLSTKDRLIQLAQPLLVERPVGSKNHDIVRDYLVSSMRKLSWSVSFDSFEQDTVDGRHKFDNIIASLHPNAPRKLVLAAHFESKKMPGFIGAIDSAVPCAILLQLAEALTPLVRRNGSSAKAELGLQFVFFDGEEAFQAWTATDSIYGARHLAARWSAEKGVSPECTVLKEMDSLVLLDLIGHKNTHFCYLSHGSSNRALVDKEKALFSGLVSAETRLRNAGLLSDSKGATFFQPVVRYGQIEDDHVPFRQRKVPVVHIIAVPFPPVWHNINDNADNINWDQSEDIGAIVQLWTAEMLHLRPIVNGSGGKEL